MRRRHRRAREDGRRGERPCASAKLTPRERTVKQLARGTVAENWTASIGSGFLRHGGSHMEAQIDRRSHGLHRLPVDLMVELSHDGDEDVYEADAIDLGRGGLGLRASVLPEVGQRLKCRFEVPGQDGLCEAQAEVVWAEDAGRWSGAFGVRFEAMDARTASALDAIAPAPIEDPGTPEELRAPRTVKLRLDGFGSAIEGEIVSDGDTIAIEQAMPFLQIGRGAEIEQGAMKVRAVLERVRLRVENGTPRLVLELAPELPAAEAREPERRDADSTIQDEDLESLIARGRVDERVDERLDERVDERDDDEPLEEPPVAPRISSRIAHSSAAPGGPSSVMRAGREVPRVVSRSESEDDGELEREEPLLAQKARAAIDALRPQLARAMASVRAFVSLAIAKGGPWLASARDALVAAFRTLASRIAQRAPKLGAALG
ncbi:MAG: PilZ domain-containing protein, partial [Myxococcota bacterium]|nr:PilZ domain-containing protein [Myxococcota bacterium]